MVQRLNCLFNGIGDVIAYVSQFVQPQRHRPSSASLGASTPSNSEAIAAGPGDAPRLPQPHPNTGPGIGGAGFLQFVGVLLLSFLALYVVIGVVGKIGSGLNYKFTNVLAGAASGAGLMYIVSVIIDGIFDLKPDKSFALHDIVLIIGGAVAMGVVSLSAR
jgi:hypothetical protein